MNPFLKMLQATIKSISQALLQPETLSAVARIVKAGLFVLIVLLLASIVVVAWKARQYLLGEQREKLRGTDIEIHPKAKTRRRWREVERQLQSPSHGAYKLAVIEADKLVDVFLKKAGYQGERMQDRLNQLNSNDFPLLDKLWEAHRTRNLIVHDLDADVPKSQAEKAVKIFGEVLKAMKVI